jgi:hypothetical protein
VPGSPAGSPACAAAHARGTRGGGATSAGRAKHGSCVTTTPLFAAISFTPASQQGSTSPHIPSVRNGR